MPRVSEEERDRFHKILDESIDKMNSSKNTTKPHWKNESIGSLQKKINVENAELDGAMYDFKENKWIPRETVESENFDLINLNMMMVDNLRGNV